MNVIELYVHYIRNANKCIQFTGSAAVHLISWLTKWKENLKQMLFIGTGIHDTRTPSRLISSSIDLFISFALSFFSLSFSLPPPLCPAIPSPSSFLPKNLTICSLLFPVCALWCDPNVIAMSYYALINAFDERRRKKNKLPVATNYAYQKIMRSVCHSLLFRFHFLVVFSSILVLSMRLWHCFALIDWWVQNNIEIVNERRDDKEPQCLRNSDIFNGKNSIEDGRHCVW